MKYIIKNCENCYFYEDDGYFCEFQKDNTMFSNPCENSTCLLKQIVEKCLDAIKTYDNNQFCEDDLDFFMGKHCGAEEILDLLEIQEIDNEDV